MGIESITKMLSVVLEETHTIDCEDGELVILQSILLDERYLEDKVFEGHIFISAIAGNTKKWIQGHKGEKHLARC